ncbi:MAG: hypothetical protein R2800_09755 [Flavipsychrobacter sp.]
MRRIFIGQMCLVVFMVASMSCNNKGVADKEKQMLDLVDSSLRYLKSGDVMLRSGNSFTSMLLANFNTKNKTYSHTGILIIEEGTPYVYHAIGGEDNPDAILRKEHLYFWCNPSFNSGFAAVRYDLDSNEVRGVISKVRSYYYNKVKFDMDFDLETDNSLYCTEMIYKAIGEATGNVNWLIPSKAANKSYIAVDDLFLHPAAKFICKVSFK